MTSSKRLLWIGGKGCDGLLVNAVGYYNIIIIIIIILWNDFIAGAHYPVYHQQGYAPFRIEFRMPFQFLNWNLN